MKVVVTNVQRRHPVSPVRMRRLVQQTARRLKIAARGTMSVIFLSPGAMRTMNRRALRHDRVTDVLSFRYDGEPVIGEIAVAPSEAAAYARMNDVPYDEELARYVVHGLLHWTGRDDRTPSQQRRMRSDENRLLRACGVMR